MKTESLLKNTALILGFFSALISITSYSQIEFYSKPLFHIVLLLSYSIFSKKIKPLVYTFFLSAIAVEYMASTDFYFYFFWILIGFTVCFISGIILLFPLLKKGNLKLKGTNLLFILIVTAGLSYIILSIYVTSIKEFNSGKLFTFVTIIFSAFILSCFYITSKYNHPKSILLFLTGMGYGITCIASLIMFTFKINSVLLIGFINLSETTAQFCFAYFMIDYNEVLNNKDLLGKI